MPVYSKTTWVDGSAPSIDATNLNKIENGIFTSLQQDGSTSMTGQLVITAGTVGTPSIAPTGDSNTGIFFPAADTIAFGEGGVEVMRITSAGNVGIGTTSPTSFGSDWTTLQVENTTGGAILRTKSTNVTADFYVANAGATAIIRTATNHPIQFQTNSVDRMIITNGGNVGIGTTSIPSVFGTTVKVAGSSGGTVDISATNVNLRQFASDGLSLAGVGTSTNHPLQLFTNDAERMRITSAGNVGIGTFTPTYKLHVNESDTAVGLSNIVGLTSQSGGVFAIGVSDKSLANPIWNITTGSNEQLAFLVGATEKMRITSAGNVGIGILSPSYQLQLSTDSAAKPSTNTWTIASDERVKTITGNYTKGLDAICALRPIIYEYNGKAGFTVDGKENISIIAQEAIEHFPECVGTFNAKLEETDEQETELYNWNGHAITFALINAVKELNAKVIALEAQLNK